MGGSSGTTPSAEPPGSGEGLRSAGAVSDPRAGRDHVGVGQGPRRGAVGQLGKLQRGSAAPWWGPRGAGAKRGRKWEKQAPSSSCSLPLPLENLLLAEPPGRGAAWSWGDPLCSLPARQVKAQRAASFLAAGAERLRVFSTAGSSLGGPSGIPDSRLLSFYLLPGKEGGSGELQTLVLHGVVRFGGFGGFFTQLSLS